MRFVGGGTAKRLHSKRMSKARSTKTITSSGFDFCFICEC